MSNNQQPLPSRMTVEQYVFDMVRLSDLNGMSSDECEALSGLSHQSVSARINALKNKGAIVAVARRKTRGGRPATVFVIADKAKAAAKRFGEQAVK